MVGLWWDYGGMQVTFGCPIRSENADISPGRPPPQPAEIVGGHQKHGTKYGEK